MKRGGFDGDAIGEPPAKRAPNRRNDLAGPSIPRTRHAFKALITDPMAAGLLGSNGSVKNEIQKETGARLVFSNRNDYFPDTKYRVMGIYADDANAILDVFTCVMPQLVSFGDEERKNMPTGQTDLCGKEPGEYIFRFALTRRMQSQIVGTQGNNIKFIRSDSGAKVFVENESIMGHRAGKVIGTPQTILAALKHINEFVQCESEFEEEFYQGYSRIVNFTEAAQRGWEPPPEPKDMDKPGGNRRLSGPQGVTTSGARVVHGKSGKGDGRPRGSVNSTKAPQYKPGSGREGRFNIVPPPPAVTPRGGGGRGAESIGEDVDSLAEALTSFPPGTVKLQYSLCCEVPAACVGLLVGAGGELIRQAEQASGAKIEIERSQGDSRTMTLVGTLLNIYLGHAIMMSRLQTFEQEQEEKEQAEQLGREDFREEDAQEREQKEDYFRDEARDDEVQEEREGNHEDLREEDQERSDDADREEDHHDREEERLEDGFVQHAEPHEDIEESDEEPEVIREQIAKLEEKLARALARRASE